MLRERVGQQFELFTVNSYTSTGNIAETLNSYTSVFHGLNSRKAMDEGCMGHVAVVRDSSIFDHGEVNPVGAINVSNPHCQPCSVLKTLPVSNFIAAWH